ncbi:MAG: hypothetical protein IJV06_10255 [Bacteroidaceae bacterium]|nr:hypothetical protein [Bacteroidaceae bacterium]
MGFRFYRVGNQSRSCRQCCGLNCLRERGALPTSFRGVAHEGAEGR